MSTTLRVRERRNVRVIVRCRFGLPGFKKADHRKGGLRTASTFGFLWCNPVTDLRSAMVERWSGQALVEDFSAVLSGVSPVFAIGTSRPVLAGSFWFQSRVRR